MPLALYSAVEGGRSAEANMYLLITVIISFALIAVVGLCRKGSQMMWIEGYSAPQNRAGCEVMQVST